MDTSGRWLRGRQILASAPEHHTLDEEMGHAFDVESIIVVAHTVDTVYKLKLYCLRNAPALVDVLRALEWGVALVHEVLVSAAATVREASRPSRWASLQAYIKR